MGVVWLPRRVGLLDLLAGLASLGAACVGVTFGDLSPLKVQIQNDTGSTVVLLDGKPGRALAASCPAPVGDGPTWAGRRSCVESGLWPPPERVGSISIRGDRYERGPHFCHEYTVNELQSMRFSV